MKNLLILLAFILISFTSFSQARTFTLAPTNQGAAIVTKSGFPTNVGDSIGISDTLNYILPINHANITELHGQINWTKVGAGTATVTANFLQSEDNINYYSVLKGVGKTAYTKTYTFSATGANEFSTAADTAYIGARYIKIQYITSNTASVQGNVNTLIRPLIK
jgi:hypothetical protein